MKKQGRGLSAKITIIVVAALAVSCVANILYFRTNIRNDAYESVKSKARAILLQAESARNYVAALRGSGAFNDAELKRAFDAKLAGATDKVAAARETAFYNTIPIISAMKIAGEHAAESGFKLRVPKVQARNKDNEPDDMERQLLGQLDKENLSELFLVDKEHNVIRYLRPIKLTKDCLVCHGGVEDTLNKDGLDLIGVKAEGWKTGEQHGAFEVLVDRAAIESGIRNKLLTSFAITFVVSVIALAFLVWAIRAIIIKPIRAIADDMQHVANGDLSFTLETSSGDEISVLAGSVNEAVDKMKETLVSVLENSCQVATAVGAVYASSEKMAAGAEDVAVQASTVATAGEEMAATSGDIAQNCQMAAEGSRVATEEAHKGAEVVQSTIDIMARIAEQVRVSSQTVASLGARSDQIGQIVGTIEDIADQTNLLALNAAIEAARAGEQGRGFAVVADEVRALAERTTKATREIAEMIKAIQQETHNAVKTMEEGVTEVERGSEHAKHSGEALERILDEINNLAMQVSQIATAAEEQTATTSEISGNMLRITDVGNIVSSNAQISANEASKLNADAEALLTSLGRFKLNEDTALILRKAKSAHLIFTGKIRGHLSGAQNISADALPSHLTCAFGKWYQGEGNEKCGRIGAFREIDAPHAKVHELGKQAIMAYNAGDTAKAHKLCAEMVETSRFLIGLLDRLAGECR